MRKSIYITALISLIELTLSASNGSDSLVLFSDLQYHSEFEKEALQNFVRHRTDTFSLFLAINEDITQEKAKRFNNIYKGIFDELNEQKVSSKNIGKKIKITDAYIHDYFQIRYNTDEYFPIMLEAGTYNCVSASMLYSLVFDSLGIPFKIMASPDHVYLIANPGKNAVVVESTNPSFEKTIFTEEFKKQYVEYLRNSSQISETDYKDKSLEEIFEERYSQVGEVVFDNLPGFQYYNKAISRLLNDKKKEAYELCQKAWFFYPEPQVKTLLYTTLLLWVEQCSFDEVSDIDYLAQLLRFENAERNSVVGIFNNIIAHYLQYNDKEEFCESLYLRLASQISDKSFLEEISFAFNLQMSYHYQNTDMVEKYVASALRIKGNHPDANTIMENHIHRKMESITGSGALLDTVILYEKKYNFEHIIPILREYQMIAFLKIASELFLQKKVKDGEEYLLQFESICLPPVSNKQIEYWVEKTYRSYAVYYFYRNDKPKAKRIVQKGLKYVPDSELLKSAVY